MNSALALVFFGLVAWAALSVIVILVLASRLAAQKREHAARETDLHGRNVSLRTEVDALAKYRHIINAEEEAQRIRYAAQQELEGARHHAASSVAVANQQAAATLNSANQQATAMLNGANGQATQIVSAAHAEAQRIAGDALQAQQNVENYTPLPSSRGHEDRLEQVT